MVQVTTSILLLEAFYYNKKEKIRRGGKKRKPVIKMLCKITGFILIFKNKGGIINTYNDTFKSHPAVCVISDFYFTNTFYKGIRLRLRRIRPPNNRPGDISSEREDTHLHMQVKINPIHGTAGLTKEKKALYIRL